MTPDLYVLAGLLGFAFLSMAVYLLGPARLNPDPESRARGGSFVFGLWMRHWFYWFLRPAERLFLALRWHPLVFNLFGVLFGLASMWLFWRGHLVLAGWGVLLGGITDIFDGRIARARNMASPRGAFLDSTLDRYAEFAVFVGIAGFFGGGTPAILCLVGLGGSLLVSYTRARGESLDVLCKQGVMQRAERLLALGFGGILDPAVSARWGRDPGALLLIVVWIIAVGTVGTTLYRTWWIAAKLRG